VNIKEIAKAVNENDLRINIYGAADSKTGTPKHNQKLSVRRAKYIAKLLMKAGVDKSKMRGFSRGGINIYKPYTANRHTCVIVYKKQQ
jgi:outer membrane protein OmpA-like peptidoglycan-associated protein